MSRRHRLVAASLAALTLAGVGVWAAAAPHPHGAAAAPPPPVTSTPPDTGDDAAPGGPTEGAAGVRWEPGPWGPAQLAGQPLLLPVSPVEGPLHDHGNGWASGYRPTALAAAIALVRGGPMLLGAPTTLHDQVQSATVTGQATAADLVGTTRNTEPAWTLPAPVLAATNGATVRLLGVVVDLHHAHAAAHVYQAVAGDSGDTLTRSDYQLRYAGGQWRIHAAGATTVVASGPPGYTLPAPSEG